MVGDTDAPQNHIYRGRDRLTFEFKREIAGDIREKLPIPFPRHVMQQAINLEKEHGPDIGYNEYPISGGCEVHEVQWAASHIRRT